MNVRLAVPLQTRNGTWITVIHGKSGWGFAWRTSIMRASAFWYYASYREMLKSRREFIAWNGGRA